MKNKIILNLLLSFPLIASCSSGNDFEKAKPIIQDILDRTHCKTYIDNMGNEREGGFDFDLIFNNSFTFESFGYHNEQTSYLDENNQAIYLEFDKDHEFYHSINFQDKSNIYMFKHNSLYYVVGVSIEQNVVSYSADQSFFNNTTAFYRVDISGTGQLTRYINLKTNGKITCKFKSKKKGNLFIDLKFDNLNEYAPHQETFVATYKDYLCTDSVYTSDEKYIRKTKFKRCKSLVDDSFLEKLISLDDEGLRALKPTEEMANSVFTFNNN